MDQTFTRLFETALFDTHWQVKYAGETRGDYATSDPQWRIWLLQWADNEDGTSSITLIRMRTGVAWDDRDSLWIF